MSYFHFFNFFFQFLWHWQQTNFLKWKNKKYTYEASRTMSSNAWNRLIALATKCQIINKNILFTRDVSKKRQGWFPGNLILCRIIKIANSLLLLSNLKAQNSLVMSACPSFRPGTNSILICVRVSICVSVCLSVCVCVSVCLTLDHSCGSRMIKLDCKN